MLAEERCAFLGLRIGRIVETGTLEQVYGRELLEGSRVGQFPVNGLCQHIRNHAVVAVPGVPRVELTLLLWGQPPFVARLKSHGELRKHLLHVDVMVVIDLHDRDGPPPRVAGAIDQKVSLIDGGEEHGAATVLSFDVGVRAADLILFVGKEALESGDVPLER